MAKELAVVPIEKLTWEEFEQIITRLRKTSKAADAEHAQELEQYRRERFRMRICKQEERHE